MSEMPRTNSKRPPDMVSSIILREQCQSFQASSFSFQAGSTVGVVRSRRQLNRPGIQPIRWFVYATQTSGVKRVI